MPVPPGMSRAVLCPRYARARSAPGAPWSVISDGLDAATRFPSSRLRRSLCHPAADGAGQCRRPCKRAASLPLRSRLSSRLLSPGPGRSSSAVSSAPASLRKRRFSRGPPRSAPRRVLPAGTAPSYLRHGCLRVARRVPLRLPPHYALVTVRASLRGTNCAKRCYEKACQ